MDEIALLNDLKNNSDSERAVQMKAYMRDRFDFLGLPAAKRRLVMRPYFKAETETDQVDWAFVQSFWAQPFRECQYIVCDYLSFKQDLLVPDDMSKIKQLALEKSWWDTIDSLDKVIGKLALDYPELNDVLLDWSTDDTIWLRRIAIDHQRLRKQAMDTQLLEKIIKNNLSSQEFFINKAIGWILRDYSKTDPEWVTQFIDTHQKEMHPLSIREGSKYLNRK